MTSANSPYSSRPYQQLFSSVVLAALDDAIADEQRYGNGVDGIGRWARSKDGQMILRCAGIEPNQRAVKGLQGFVDQGVKTSVALSREAQQVAKQDPAPLELFVA